MKLKILSSISDYNSDSEYSDSEYSDNEYSDSEQIDDKQFLPSDSKHRDNISVRVLDLQKHNKLEKLELRHVSFGSLLLPVEGARITSLEMHNVRMTHHGLKQLGDSLSSCSSLGGIDLNKVACIEHRDGCCCLFLDLHNYNKLETLKVRNSSVDSLHLSVEGARITSLILCNVTMTHHGLEHLVDTLSSCSSLERIKLNKVTCLSLERVSIETASLNEVTHKHRDNSCILFLDLQYNNLKVQNSYVDSLCRPVEGARITSLELAVVTMTHRGLKQLGESLSSCSSLGE